MPGPAVKEMAIPDLVIPSTPASKPSMKPNVSSRPVPVVAPTPSAFDDELGFGGGSNDLQIDLSAVHAAPTTSSVGIQRPPTPGAGFSPFDDDIAAGPSLELDTTQGGPSIPAPPRSGTSMPAPFPSASAPVSMRAPAEGRPSHSSVTDGVTADPFEAKVLADYGPPPDAFWQTPMYAYRVVKRRGELRRALAEVKLDAERSLKLVEDALVALGERARSMTKDGASTSAAPMLERVQQAEELLRSRDTALAGTMDAHRSTLAEIETRLGIAEADLARAKDAEARAQAAFETADADMARADAKLKRIDIEIRNGVAGRAGERDACAAELADKTPKRAEAERALAEARRVVNVAGVRVTAVTGERTAQNQRFSRQSSTRGAGVDDAQAQLRSALALLGRALIADGSSAGTEEALNLARNAVARLEEQAQTKTKSLALHQSALSAFDAGKVVLGLTLVLLAVGLLILLACFPAIYRAFAT